jgi:hypothetical protein
MSKRGKNSKQKQQVVKSVEFSQHAMEMLEKRFAGEVVSIDVKRMKNVTQQNAFKFPVLAQKYRSGIHLNTRYLVDSSRNLALAVVDNVVRTVLYLDGSYGYNF